MEGKSEGGWLRRGKAEGEKRRGQVGGERRGEERERERERERGGERGEGGGERRWGD